MTPKTFSVSLHVNWGQHIKDARDCLQSLACSLPRDSRASRQARRAFHAVEELRRSLDNIVRDDVPRARDPRNLAVTVYYGITRLESRLVDPAAFAVDDFAGYRETR